MNIEKVKIAVIGQGYVGLPLAIEFGKKYPTLGFDINQSRIDELKKYYKTSDKTRQNSASTNYMY